MHSIALTCALASLSSPPTPPQLPVPIATLVEWIALETGRPVALPLEIEAVDDAALATIATAAEGAHRDPWVETLCPSPPRVAQRQLSNAEAIAREAVSAGCRFDPATKRVFVARDPGSIDSRALVRECVRAVIDRQLDTERFASEGPTPDAVAARRLIVAGLAEFLARRVISRRANELAPTAVVPAAGVPDLRARLAGLGASPFLVERSANALEVGLRFVERAHAEAGADGLRRMLAQPPASTEQVVDPGKWLGIEPRDEPEPPEDRDLLTLLPEGSKRAVSTALGAFEGEIVLRLGGDPIRAFRATRTFDGDVFVGYEVGPAATRLVQWRIRCDDPRDTELCLHAVRKLVEEQIVEPPLDGPREDVAIEYDDPITKLVAKRKSDGRVRAIAWSDGATIELLLARDGELDLATLAPR